MTILSKLLRIIGAASLTLLAFLVVQPASAATSTVCAASCDFTTLSDALDYATNTGDVVSVEVGYDSSADTATYPITTIAPGVTIDCQNSGAIISQTAASESNLIYLSAESTIRNCTLGNISLRSDATSPSGIQILNNTFSTTVTSTIIFEQGPVNSFLIEGNRNINAFVIRDTVASAGGIVRNNTFHFRDISGEMAAFNLKFTGNTGLQIVNNTFESYIAAAGSPILIYIAGADTTFTTNTVKYLTTPDESLYNSVEIQGTGTMTFSGNIIQAPPSSTGGCSAVGLFLTADTLVTWNVDHNTLKIPATCGDSMDGGYALTFNDRHQDGGTLQANVSYNLFVREGAMRSDQAIRLERESDTSGFVLSNDHNAIYRFGTPLKDKRNNTGAALDAATYYADPFFRTANIATDDDDELAPFSPYLDIVGTNDIGAITGSHSALLTVDAEGVVDYTSVHATSTVGIGDALRSGGTLQLMPGTYAPFAVSSTLATTTIAITGVGADVIIDGNLSTVEDGITLTSVTSSAISNITIRNASSTAAGLYLIDLMNGAFEGTIYDHAFAGMGIPASSTIIVMGESPTSYTTDAYDVTDAFSLGIGDFHLVLADFGGGEKVTILIPAFLASSAAEVSAGLGIIVDAFATSTISYNSGDQTYTFNQVALDEAGITLSPWVLPAPQVQKTTGRRLSGIRLDNSHGVTVTNVTSTENGNGITFGPGSGQNVVTDSVISASVATNMRHESDEQNIFDNVTSDLSTRTFTSTGMLLVKYDARVRTVDVDGGAPIAGATVTVSDPAASGITDGSGYTAYASLLSYEFTAAGNAFYGPYIFEAAADGYSATSTSLNLDFQNQTVQLAMFSSSGPNAPSAAGAAHVSTSTATFGWTDNADNEDSFSVEYRRPLTGEEYPGTPISVTGVTYVDMTGLTPGEQYEFRVAAVNTVATSTYATSTVFTMDANVPSAPTLTALSRTSLSIDLGTNGNATSVEYAVYSSTLSGYLDALAAVTGTAVWQTSSTRSTITVPALTCGTTYSFSVIARNVDENESATSTASSVATSACASAPVSSGGGGGAVGGGGGASGPIQTFFTTTQIPAFVPPVSMLPPPVSAPVTPAPVVVPENPLPTTPVLPPQTLETFIQTGGSAGSRALGRGEREAVIRDLQEILGRTATNLPVADLDRISNGQIPLTRNLAYERSLAPRALATFRTMFGHAPNFQNQAENLAWNTLMYRIRFPRNLVLEREGIAEYRRTFRGAPQSPFQWAVVRVLGYVNE